MEALLAQDTDRRIGVLLAQLGTPDAPTPAALRRYLRQFLSDRRVVERNRVLWWFVLRLLVCRAGLAGRLRSTGGSGRPTARRCSSSRDRRRARSKPSSIATSRNDSRSRWACATAVRRSSRPCRELLDWGADRLLLFPLYPQYAGATTGSTYDEVFRQLSTLRFVPALRVVPPYYAHPAYIEALAAVGS